jgi:hypothetical protein
MMISYISWKFMLLCSMHQVGASESARASYRNCKETYGTKAISYLHSCVGNSLRSDLSHLKISCNCLSCIGLRLASFCSTDLLRRLNIFHITLVIIKNGDIMWRGRWCKDMLEGLWYDLVSSHTVMYIELCRNPFSGCCWIH